jgi:hypothetical protein
VGGLVEGGVIDGPQIIMVIAHGKVDIRIHIPVCLDAGQILISAENRGVADGGDGVRILLIGETISQGDGNLAHHDGHRELGVGGE